MKTIKELNEKTWYRFLKVLYIALYALYGGTLIFSIVSFGREYHPKNLPSTFSEAVTDPDFKDLDSEKKREVLSEINEDFSSLFSDTQKKVIETADAFRVQEAREAGYSDAEIINYLAVSGIPKPKEYTVTDTRTNRTIVFEWFAKDPATEANIEEIFIAVSKVKIVDPFDLPHSDKWKVKALGKPVTDPNILSALNKNPKPKKEYSDSPEGGPWDDYKGFKLDYNYSDYYSWKKKDIFYYSAIFSICFILIMEAVRRSFYYIVLGRVFPKKETLP